MQKCLIPLIPKIKLTESFLIYLKDISSNNTKTGRFGPVFFLFYFKTYFIFAYEKMREFYNQVRNLPQVPGVLN
jgi:hypothetical protein